MTKIKIESKLAEAANADPGARIAAGGQPYEATTWEGEADLPADDPEAAFRFFNRVEQPDVDRLEAIGYHLPSLSVGDRLTLDGRTFEVASLGFNYIGSAD